MTDKKDNIAFTARELEILSKGWSCMKTKPEMDYVKLAEATGMTNQGSAYNAWNRIKQKLWSDVPDTPKSNGKKRGASTPADGDADADVDTTPAPCAKKPRKKRVTKAKKEKLAGSDDEEVPTVKKEKVEELEEKEVVFT